MLTTCPECALPVSDKAAFCPHCGNPFNTVITHKRRPSKRMRLPNGFGQITEIKNRNLAKPFRAMVTVGTSDNGRPIVKTLKPQGYFKTYNDAYMALMEYHKDPRLLDAGMTLADIYPKWRKDRVEDQKSTAVLRATEFGWNHIQSITNIPVRTLKQSDIRACLEENVDLSSSAKGHIKNVLNQMLDYCVENGLVNENVSRKLVIKQKKTPEKHHIPFEDWEMETLWSHAGENIFVDMILVDCYSGWRPSELLLLKTANISSDTMTGGMKTDAGKNRVIPIHSRIKPIIERYLTNDTEYLFPLSGHKVSYDTFRKAFEKLMDEYQLNKEHLPHDCRVKFISMLKNAGANEFVIKRLAGHTVSDITESVYTNWNPDVVKQELEKIK